MNSPITNHLILDKETLKRYSLLRFHAEPEIQRDDASKIQHYLENPVAAGIWRLSATWNEGNGISNDVWAELEKEIGNKDSIHIRSGKREKRIRITPERKEVLRTDIFERITFLMILFQSLAEQSSEQEADEYTFNTEDDDAQLVLDLIDTSAIAVKYVEALRYFKENIWHKGFSPTIKQDSITRIKAGSFILLKGPRDGGSVVIISWLREPLESFKKFLDMLGKFDDSTLIPIFSPEEEAFAPYFDLLRMAQDHLIKQDHLKPIIKKSLSNFRENNYSDCVSSLGLAAEDVLTQIYETLFREQLTKGLTLGQLFDEIHNKSAQAFPKKEESPPDLSTLFQDIKRALEADSTGPHQALEITRKILAQVIESNRHLQAKIEKIGRIERRISLFPEKISHLVNELIKFRNAASHRSRVPIGPYECRRSAYAFVVLYCWWERERRGIDWSKQPKEILSDCIQRNASSS